MSAPTTRPTSRQLWARSPIDPFTSGMLVAGIAVGMPASVAWGLVAGQLVKALLVPVATIMLTTGLWLRVRGRSGVATDLRTPLVRRNELPRFLAGVVVAVLALMGLMAGAR